jgi:hypothetical protein
MYVTVACAFPSHYLSLITDGMAQNHCELPYLANVAKFPTPLPHHVQGVIAHGRHINIFRNFHNVPNRANFQIHTLLLTIEKIRDALPDKKLPDTIYIQVDGGPENANSTVLGMCELLVAKKLCKHVVLSRLIPGHTHEDIDSKFGVIWQHIRSK